MFALLLHLWDVVLMRSPMQRSQVMHATNAATSVALSLSRCGHVGFLNLMWACQVAYHDAIWPPDDTKTDRSRQTHIMSTKFGGQVYNSVAINLLLRSAVIAV